MKTFAQITTREKLPGEPLPLRKAPPPRQAHEAKAAERPPQDERQSRPPVHKAPERPAPHHGTPSARRGASMDSRTFAKVMRTLMRE